MGSSMLMDTLFWAVKAPHHLLASLLCTHMSRRRYEKPHAHINIYTGAVCWLVNICILCAEMEFSTLKLDLEIIC